MSNPKGIVIIIIIVFCGFQSNNPHTFTTGWCVLTELANSF